MVTAAQKALDDIGAAHIDARAMTNTPGYAGTASWWRWPRSGCSSPEVLVVDETTTALSQEGRNIIYGLMDRMRRSHRAVVFISHDLDEIKERCDTLTVLRDGHIIRTFEKRSMTTTPSAPP